MGVVASAQLRLCRILIRWYYANDSRKVGHEKDREETLVCSTGVFFFRRREGPKISL